MAVNRADIMGIEGLGIGYSVLGIR